jgi:hypothetical protein
MPQGKCQWVRGCAEIKLSRILRFVSAQSPPPLCIAAIDIITATVDKDDRLAWMQYYSILIVASSE